MYNDDILFLEKYLVNNRYGIIKNFIEVESPSEFPHVYRFKAHKENLINFQKNCNDGFGYNFSKEQAKRSALGEAIERYCASYIPNNLLKTSYKKLIENENVIDPNLFIQKDCEYKKIDENKEIFWTPAVDILTNNKCYVPSSVIYLPLSSDEAFPILRSQNSTGLACGTSLRNAIISGIYECVERDAFAIMWYNKLVGRTISLNMLDKENREIIERFGELGFKIIIKQINSDIDIPVYFSVLLNENNERLPRMYVSAKSGRDFNNIIYNMLGELIGGYYSLIELKELYNVRIPKRIKDINSLEDHALFYGYNKANIDFLIKEEIIESNKIKLNEMLDDGIDDIERIKNILLKSGIDIYYSDITTNDINELGLKVVRVLSTKLCFLESDYSFYNNNRININNTKNEIAHPFS